MSIFSDKRKEAFETGVYICNKCGAQMKFEDQSEITLICSQCNYEQNPEEYGFTEDEAYETLYMTKEEVQEKEDYEKNKK